MSKQNIIILKIPIANFLLYRGSLENEILPIFFLSSKRYIQIRNPYNKTKVACILQHVNGQEYEFMNAINDKVLQISSSHFAPPMAECSPNRDCLAIHH